MSIDPDLSTDVQNWFENRLPFNPFDKYVDGFAQMGFKLYPQENLKKSIISFYFGDDVRLLTLEIIGVL